MKIAYSYYVLDIIHKGHLEMLKNSKAIVGKDGKLIVGILTDEAVMERKPRPVLSFSERVELARAIKYVDLVVEQKQYSPLETIKQIKPDILMESTSHDQNNIEKAEEFMQSIGGRVIVIPYYSFTSSTKIKSIIKGKNEK